ncbi:similar to methylenetetrahydrofolate dehydrogenase [Plenodomus lingam JN3]|uniref:Similar to methylenetetrahydrofolate dehydrogenase n=1 Tax=Leptosphaeria maculans (strain JN3 / isolate v23.1.3 / race Av1-4-5-6-7-8) TaxID=985895 RepID=E4ZVV6_LEPMJ|nr:similar to methylenetetrahydrofolate dehydrogenase [Plenodomus lingam JN3]CBX95732.1 similar to methylenetetrahydrofolate dehydrogenase [Plenodomus lingam JN3]
MAEEKPNCKVILANNIAKSLLEEVRGGLSKIDRKPLLVGFLSSADPAARVYAEWTGKTCVENGFAFDLREVDRELLEDQLIEANNDPSVDGIIVYYPIFGNRQDQYLQQIVSIDKDVEGLSHRYIFNMYQNIRFPGPCKHQEKLHGRTITVINRSEVVGRPLAALLANDGAHVYSVDINDVQEFTRGVGLRKRRHEVVEKPGWTIENCLPISDVVISGVPGDKYKVPLETMKDGAVCINFSSERNFTPEVKEKASIYVPAIGKVTIAVLLRNLLRLAQNRIDAAANNVESKSSEEANALASS